MTRSLNLAEWITIGVIAITFAVLIVLSVADGISKDRQAEQAMSVYAQERYQAGYLQALRDTGAAPAPMGGAK